MRSAVRLCIMLFGPQGSKIIAGYGLAAGKTGVKSIE